MNVEIKNLQASRFVVDKLEESLQTVYNSKQEFNEVLDDADPLVIKGLKQSYVYKPSEILYWVDRKAYLDELEHWEGCSVQEQHEEAQRYLKDTGQGGVFLSLVEAMASGRVVPFVGAGLSKACGYPMWGEALEKLCKKLQPMTGVPDIAHLLAQYDYLKAAQVLHDHSAEQVRQFVKTEFRQGNWGLQGAVLLIPKLTHGCVITTNFDTVIEDAFSQQGQHLDGYMYGMQTHNNFVQSLVKGKHCILKLHGDAGQEKSYVFTEQQYIQAYGEPLSFQHQLPRALRQIFISHSLVFVGCSLEQDKTLELFKDVVDEAAFEIPEHFALLNTPGSQEEKAQKEQRLLKLKIQPLWYDAPEHDHAMLERILRLALAVSCRQISF